jgi:hypothetical protein
MVENWRTELRDQWQQSPLLRLGVAAVVLIAAWYAHLLIQDWKADQADEAGRLAERLARLEAVQQQTQWQERADAAKAVAARMEDRFWTAPTRGIGQADFQTWLERARARAGLPDMQQAVGGMEAVDNLKGVFLTHAEVEGAFRPAALWQLIEAVETHDKALRVEQLDIRGGHVALRVGAFLKETGGGNGD